MCVCNKTHTPNVCVFSFSIEKIELYIYCLTILLLGKKNDN